MPLYSKPILASPSPFATFCHDWASVEPFFLGILITLWL
jgi:hypothetical protein